MRSPMKSVEQARQPNAGLLSGVAARSIAAEELSPELVWAFVAVVDLDGFTRAARVLHRTQSTTRLVEQAGVLLLPAGVYVSELNSAPADRFRVDDGRANLEESVDALRAFLKSNAV